MSKKTDHERIQEIREKAKVTRLERNFTFANKSRVKDGEGKGSMFNHETGSFE